MTTIRWHDVETPRDDLDQLIPCIERAFQVTLPDDFKECAIAHGGGRPIPGRFDTEREKGKVFTQLFSLNPCSDMFIRNHYTRLPEWRKLLWPIGYDSLKNYVSFDYGQGSSPHIMYRVVPPNILEDQHRDFICSSFTELLDMFY